MEKILVVEDDGSMREFLEIMLRSEGYEVSSASTVQKALELLKEREFATVLTDLKLGRGSGLDIVRAARKSNENTEVVVVTAFASAESATAAMKLGAFDYVTKPFKVDEVKLIIRNAVAKFSLASENIRLRRELESKFGLENIILGSPQMQRIADLVRRFAPTKANVLISGESGTGKELVAKAFHYNSPRRQMPFVTVSCGAIPESLMESEMFGHLKGSFSGAIANKEGLFEHADGGTAFLDEIGELPLSVQVKLLRLIQEKTFRKVGGVDDIKVDVRIVAATNRDLEAEVRNSRFREDLYYRLNVITIDLPPLRDRRDDIDLLVRHFIRKYKAEQENSRINGPSPEAIEMLRAYDYPGNVRELENIIERAMTLETTEMITPESLPAAVRLPGVDWRAAGFSIPEQGLDLRSAVSEHEARYIRAAIEATGGDRTKAARLLNLSLRQLRYKLQKMRTK